MAKQPPQPDLIGYISSPLAGASSNSSSSGTPQPCRHQLIHRDAANVATKNDTHDPHSKLACNPGGGKNKQQHVVCCEYIHTVVHGHQFTVCHVADVHRETPEKFITSRNGIHPWSTTAFVRDVSEIKHHHVVHSGIVVETFRDKHPPVRM